MRLVMQSGEDDLSDDCYIPLCPKHRIVMTKSVIVIGEAWLCKECITERTNDLWKEILERAIREMR